ncbi:MAG: acyl-CoA synthetase (AMP-forming)/AMP-acid ligase II, partial [Glaciecola sp.]
MAKPVRDLLAGRGVHLGELADVLADQYGDRVAIEDPASTPGLHVGGARSYIDLASHVTRLAAAHAGNGRTAGERVLLMVDNRIDVILHAMALARLGAVAIPVNARLREAELSAVATAAGASAVIADAEHADRLEQLDDDVLSALAVQRTGDDGGPGLALWLTANPAATLAPRNLDPRTTVLLLATSGTTGLPKAAALTSRGLTASMGRLLLVPLGYQSGPRKGRDLLLAALPLTHVMGFIGVLGAMSAGVPFVHRPRFDAAEMLDLIEQRRPNPFVGVPTMYADLERAGA